MRLLALATLLVLASMSFADGKFFSRRLVESRPTIPFQRAVLKFDGREEVMLVESTLSGPQGTYGWVIPLPRKPSYVKAVNPAYIESSFKFVKPRVQGANDFPMGALLSAILFAAIVLTSGLRHRSKDLGHRVLYFFFELFIPIAVFLVLLPVFAQSKEAAKKSAATADIKRAIEVESLGSIGSYDVSVLAGEQGEPILDWLKERDLAVGDDALPVIHAYAKEGWCFLAAEVRKKENGTYPPHPIKAVFPSDRLIYPMRLTGIQDQPLRLELLVVSDREATVSGMKPWACDNSDIRVPIGIDTAQDKEIYADWKSGEYAMAKDGMVWTYLRGEFEPAKMKQDFGVEWKQMERSRVEIWDRQGAIHAGIELFAIYFAAAAGLIGLILTCMSSPNEAAFGVGALFAVLIAVFVSVSWHSSVEKVDSEHDPSPRRSISRVD